MIAPDDPAAGSSELDSAEAEEALVELRRFLVRQRLYLKLTQGQVAKQMGTTQSALSELESGKTRDPGVRTLIRWAAALDVQLEIVASVLVRTHFPMNPAPPAPIPGVAQ